MKNAICPACQKVVELQEDTRVQELISCPNCKSLLEFVRLFPPTLDWAEDPAISSSRRWFMKLY